MKTIQRESLDAVDATWDAISPCRPGLLGDRARALVDGVRVQAEAGDEQQRGREQEDEDPVGERAGEKSASDRGVALDEGEAEVDGRVVGAHRVDARAEDSCALRPARDRPATVGSSSISIGPPRRLIRRVGIAHPPQPERLISAGSRAARASSASSLRTRASKYT